MRRFLGLAILSLAAQGAAQTPLLTPSDLLSRSRGDAGAEAASAPLIRQGYLYVESHQCRFEALLDSATVFGWLRPGQSLPNALTPELHKALTSQAAAKAADWCRASINGQPGTVRFTGAGIVKGAPGRTLPMEDTEIVPLAQAMVGFTWEMPTVPSPETIEVEWSGFFEGMDRLPVRVFFGPLSETFEITKSSPKFTWQNRGRLARPAALAEVPPIAAPPPFRLPLAALICFGGGLLFYIAAKRRGYHLRGGTLPFLGVWLVLVVLLWPLLRVEVPRPARGPGVANAAEAETVITPLLRNVYRAFDHRHESAIYDVLERSVDGPLLRQLYLETIQALTLEGREGTRVTISEFDATVTDVKEAADRAGFVAACQWTALGSVGHWGHTHQRVNRYTATVTVRPVGGEWKLTALEVTEARRL